MRVSYRWLKELLPGLTVPAETIAERLTRAGLEVEAIERFGAPPEVLVAEVAAVEPHPNRDRLRLVTVQLGKENTQRVVCGASNVPDPGGRVAFAPEGTYLPAVDLTLSARAIGGIESAGMLCSETELGLAEAADGILILPDDAEVGASLSSALPHTSDIIFEVGVTPNRPDALGHVGIARDVAALLGLPFAMPEISSFEGKTSSDTAQARVTVENKAPDRCPRYLAGMVTGVTVERSPDWLRYRLVSLGIRPISNVVDITNLLLMLYGQPMHAFDFELVRGGRIVVRQAQAGEPFTTLDGIKRSLDEDDLVICDGEGPTALAGIMGGEDSEIRDTTRTVLLECAYFTTRGVRRTARRHGMHTESSHRFERGVDWGGTDRVLEHAKALLSDLAGATVLSGTVRAEGDALVRPQARIRSGRLDALLGTAVPFDEARSILERLGFAVGADKGAEQERYLEVTVPSFRPDVSMEADLIEEVARIRGLDAIVARLPAVLPQPPRTTGRLARLTAHTAAELGLSETIAYAFVSETDLSALSAPEPAVVLEYPLSAERSVMRTSLLPGLLEAVRRARRRGEHEARLFSIGSLFLPPTARAQSPAAEAARPRMPKDTAALPEERLAFAAVLAGPRPGYLRRTEEMDVYDAKGLAEELIERLTGHGVALRAIGKNAAHLHPRGAAEVLVEQRPVGRLGPIHPAVADALDLGGPVQLVEIDLVSLEAIPERAPRFRPIPRLPAVSRDIAVVVPDSLAARELERTIAEAAGELCESVELFDVFQGQGIPEAHRSLAYRVVYRDPKATTDPENARTLTDREVDTCHDRVRKAASALGELRA